MIYLPENLCYWWKNGLKYDCMIPLLLETFFVAYCVTYFNMKSTFQIQK